MYVRICAITFSSAGRRETDVGADGVQNADLMTDEDDYLEAKRRRKLSKIRCARVEFAGTGTR